MLAAMISILLEYPIALAVPVLNSLSKESVPKFQTRGESIPLGGSPHLV